jgi:asparagine synthase (glutamine-hydrolysing)
MKSSTTHQNCLVLGAPRFRDPALARCAAEHGTRAAWLAALVRDPREAAALAEGEFAVGLRDPSGRTFLAVDRFAVRTLCYRIVNGELHFASRADELAGESEIDLQALFDYGYFHFIPAPRTIFRGVFRLPPAHYAVFENGSLTIAPYWVPEFDDARRWSFPAAKAEFRDLLRNAVAAQLDGSKPACFLSGGTDSSTVAGLIGQVCGQPAATYSIGFEAEGYDEMEFARIAARHFQTEHHEYYVTPEDLVASIPLVAAHYDQPFGNSSALPAYYCARMAHDDGVTRLLAGDGGDELFGGNTRYAKQRIFGWYDAVPASVRHMLLEPVAGLPAAAQVPLLRKAASYIAQARVVMPGRMQTYNQLIRMGTDSVFTDHFLANVDTSEQERQQREVWQAAHTHSLVNRMLAFDWRYTLAENDLPKVCGTTQLAEVSVGFPFLDPELLAFSLRLPADAKLKGLKLRWFFKEALRGFLPDQIIAKKKQGFGLPFGVWAMRHEALHRLAANSLGSLSTRGVVRPQFLKQLLDVHLPSHPGYYGEMVWILMMLEQWLQSHAPDFALTR